MIEQQIKLPRNIEAEAALLGAILIDNRVFESLPVHLAPDHFFEPVHSRIFERAVEVIGQGRIANPATLRPYFDADEGMKLVGGPGYMAQLTGSGAGLIGARDFARQIYDLAVLRNIITLGTSIVESALDTSEAIDPEAIIEAAQGDLQRLYGAGKVEAVSMTALDCVDELMSEWDQPIVGVASGCIPELDRALGPLRPTKFSVLAGRPGMGKTALAVSYANGVARRGMDPTDPQGGGVAIVSHEMPSIEIGGRLVADTAAYSNQPLLYEKVEGNRLDSAEREKVIRIRDGFKKLPLDIIPMPTITVPALRALVRRKKAAFLKRWGVPLRLLIVDYLQLMTGTAKGRADNRVAEISEISRGLKQIAMEEDIHVMALSQLSRALESRDDKKPRLNDLRESGTIEQDADIVVGLFSEVYYHEQAKPSVKDKEYADKLVFWNADREALKDKIEFGILKRRSGRAGYWIEGRFYREHQAIRGAGL